MNSLPKLDARSLSIIKSLVEEYMQSGEPIASGTIAAKQGVNLSAASVRNVMSKLEELGLIAPVHTSSGRLPTTQGVRIYLSTLLRMQRPSKKIKMQLQKQIDTSELNTMAASAIETVSDLTKMVALVTLPSTYVSQISRIHFVSLSQDKVVVVLVTMTGEVRNRILELNSPIKKRDFELAEQFFNSHFAGKSMYEARSELVSKLANLKNNLAELLKQMVSAVSVNDSTAPRLLTSGSDMLFSNADLIANAQQLQEMLGLLNRKETLLHLLDQGINSNDVSVYIGSESGIPELANSSVVMSNYENEKGEVIGALGLIGPMRMEYSQVLPIVDVTATLMGDAVAKMQYR